LGTNTICVFEEEYGVAELKKNKEKRDEKVIFCFRDCDHHGDDRFC
jgi:hypothetical protein